jgi:orotidine-5'-phosphate decarboxylase
MNFLEKLESAQWDHDSWLCVGLDPVWERLPAGIRAGDDPLLAFGRAIVEATADLACAFKPNLGFWLAEGPRGIEALRALIAAIPREIPVVLDAKFGDVGHTAQAYAHAAFEALGADAVTVNPYLGQDSLRPFLEWPERGVYLLARTSNPSAGDVQDLQVAEEPVYRRVADLALAWHETHPNPCGLVIGATYPEELAQLRRHAPGLPFLIPGVGSQGGSLETAVRQGPTADGLGPLINASRGILYASEKGDFAEAAREAAWGLRERINALREESYA